MKAIIVDDEPKSIELILGYLFHFPEIEVTATFRNGLKALNYLKDTPVDLIFLDINMPHLSGLSLSRMIHPGIKVIFITAYPQHAPESYEVDAIDYLLKPVHFERFTRAIHKALKNNGSGAASNADPEVIGLKSSGKIFRVHVSDICFLEKAANYMTYHTRDKKIVVRITTGEALGELPDFFIQVHKSFIVNCKMIEYYNKEDIGIQNLKIPIGNRYRDGFLQHMGAREY